MLLGEVPAIEETLLAVRRTQTTKGILLQKGQGTEILEIIMSHLSL